MLGLFVSPCKPPNMDYSARLLLFDFSRSFNTIQCHLLAHNLLEMKIEVPAVLWIKDCLTNRPQFVKIGANDKSETQYTNTGDRHGGLVVKASAS